MTDVTTPMEARARCGTCSALLGAYGDWCTQCFTPSSAPAEGQPAPGGSSEAEAVDSKEVDLTDERIAALLTVPESLRDADPSLWETLRSRRYGAGAVAAATVLLTLLLCGALVAPRMVTGGGGSQTGTTTGPLAGIPQSAPVEAGPGR